jgi:hypothetical protein
VFPVRYEFSFYTPEDGTLYSHHRENLKSYIALVTYALSVSEGARTSTVT